MEHRIISREEWGARYPDGFYDREPRNLERWLHHSVTMAPDLLPPFDDDFKAIRTLESIGQSRFKGGISYTFAVTPAGLIFEGHSIGRVGSHTQNHNRRGAGIVLVGNYQNTKPTSEALEGVTWLLDFGVGQDWWDSPTLSGGHRDTKATACPGNEAYAMIDDINRGEFRTAEPISNPVPVTPAPVTPAPMPSGIDVDGKWGAQTTTRMQQILGTSVDGVVSSQSAYWQPRNPGLTSGWGWVNPTAARGSRMIAAHQSVLRSRGRYGGDIDGLAGPGYFRALQSDLGTLQDGFVSNPSQMVSALQGRLNEGRI
jgi:hypothetical protein